MINLLKILSRHKRVGFFAIFFIQISKIPIKRQYLPKLKSFIKNGTPKQAKYSIRCIHSNYNGVETILNDLYEVNTIF